MICRRERDGLLLFEASTGQTAFLSGEELRVLENWLETGRDSAFVRRLHDLRVLRPLRPEQNEICWNKSDRNTLHLLFTA